MAKTAIAEPLTKLELVALKDAEATIQRGLATFMDVGTALFDIREGRLYRDTHKTFEAYCQEKWGISRPRAYQLIEAAETTARLSTMVDKVPENERHVRELAKVPEEQRAAVWEDVLEETDGNPTARDVREVAERYLADNEPYEEQEETEKESGPNRAAVSLQTEARQRARKLVGQLIRALDDAKLLKKCRTHVEAIKKAIH